MLLKMLIVIYIIGVFAAYSGLKKATIYSLDPIQKNANIVLSIIWPVTILVMFLINQYSRWRYRI